MPEKLKWFHQKNVYQSGFGNKATRNGAAQQGINAPESKLLKVNSLIK